MICNFYKQTYILFITNLVLIDLLTNYGEAVRKKFLKHDSLSYEYYDKPEFNNLRTLVSPQVLNKQTVNYKRDNLAAVKHQAKKIFDINSINEEQKLTKVVSKREANNETYIVYTCPSDWLQFKKNCYSFIRWKVSFAEARTNCIKKRSHLVKIDSEEENQYITDHIFDDSWIGLNDQDKEGHFVWHDKSEPKYTSWQAGEPDNGILLFPQHCVRISGGKSSGYWSDMACTAKYFHICHIRLDTNEFIEEPAKEYGWILGVIFGVLLFLIIIYYLCGICVSKEENKKNELEEGKDEENNENNDKEKNEGNMIEKDMLKSESSVREGEDIGTDSIHVKLYSQNTQYKAT